jgi:hypothetical protein
MKAGPLTLPAALVLAMCAPAAAQVPSFGVERICTASIENPRTHEACLRDEREAQGSLEARWNQFPSADRTHCVSETSLDNSPSYVELMVCLQIAAELKKLPKKNVDFAPYPQSVKK